MIDGARFRPQRVPYRRELRWLIPVMVVCLIAFFAPLVWVWTTM